MKLLSLKFLPFIILLSGPPAFRKMSVDTNIVEANIDIWIIIQIIAYFTAFYLMIKNMPKNIHYNRDTYDVIIFLTLISLFISSLLSNEIVTSLAYTFLYFIGIFSYYYSKNIFQDLNNQNIISIYELIRNIFFILLLIVIFLNIFTNGYVATESRISGGRIVNVLIICPVIFLISLYMIIIGSKTFLNKVCLIISAFMIFFAYSRSTWWSTIFFTFMILCKVFYLDNENKSDNFRKRSIFYFFIFFLIVLTLIYFSEIINFLTRGQKDPFSLSGRDLISYWVFDQMNDNLFGYGLGTGFKRIFPSLIGVFDQYGLDSKSIGTAHNAYLQILIEGGWISFVCYILLSIFPILYFIKNIKKLINSNFFLLFVIFLFLISNNLINASSVMPSYATFGLFWLILSLINIHIRKKI